jgi:sugar-specific transcriptional regulator TrmB
MDTMLYLQKLGMTRYQSSVLSNILAKQNSTALEISEITQVPYTKIYQVLDSLRYMGFVVADLERPMRFRAVDIDAIVDKLVKSHQESLSRIKRVGEEVKAAYRPDMDEFHTEKAI